MNNVLSDPTLMFEGLLLGRSGRSPRVRTTFQLAADFIRTPDHSLQQIEVGVRDLILDWFQRSCPLRMPPEAWSGESFEVGEDVSHRLECISIPVRGIWSARLTEPDLVPQRQEYGAPVSTQRTTEIALARTETEIRFGVRVVGGGLPGADQSLTVTRPGVVSELAHRFYLREAERLSLLPWRLQTEEDLDRFHDLLTSPKRQLPVYLLTEPDPSKLKLKVSTFLLDELRLAEAVLGVAYVVALPWDLGYRWTERVGKTWSAFLGAVRTYRPGLDFDQDSPFDHPRILAQRILGFRYRGFAMERAFEEFLTDQAFEYALSRRMDWGKCLFFVDARRRRAEMALEHVRESSEFSRLYEEENASLREKLEQLEAENEDVLQMVEVAEQERDQLAKENHKLRARIETLHQALKDKTGQSSVNDLSLPTSYETLPEWVENHLVEHLILHPRAINRGIKAAQYENVEMVARVLGILANEYRDMRLGKLKRDAFERRLDEIGLRWDDSITETRAGEEGDTYYVRYPTASSPRQFLKSHIRTKGNTRDPKRCLAVYFFWDDQTRRVVVGWLPNHLSNRLT